MPVKKLPRKLVQRLKRLVKRENVKNQPSRDSDSLRIYSLLGRMKNIDHRRNDPLLGHAPREATGYFARNVREMDVSRNYPKEKLVIKRVHGGTARETIKFVRNLVSRHNNEKKPEKYKLVMPKAYAIGENLVAMAKTDCPSIGEIIGGREYNTQRGETFLKEKLGVEKFALSRASDELRKNLSEYLIDYKSNIIVLGMNRGKFIFMPLVDMV